LQHKFLRERVFPGELEQQEIGMGKKSKSGFASSS
jgi:hypothetical protein